MRFLLPLLLALLTCVAASAQDAPAAPEPGAEQTAPSPEEDGQADRNPFTKGLRVYFGRVEAEPDQGLGDPGEDTSVGVEFGDRLPGLGGYLGYDTGVWLSFRDYENALDAALGITDPQIDASWVGVTGGLRLTVPRQTPFRFHAVAGAGLFRSTLSSSGPGYVGRAEDADTAFGGYAGIALEYHWTGWGLGLDLRRFWVPADFDDFGLDDVDLGGDFLGLVVRKNF
jgi:hypothetical protein